MNVEQLLNERDVPVKQWSPIRNTCDENGRLPFDSPLVSFDSMNKRGTGPRPKRKRATPSQLLILTQIYEQTDGFPSTELRKQLALQLGLTPRTVQIWFQNKRQSLKKQKELLDAISPPYLQLLEDERSMKSPPMTPSDQANTNIQAQDWDTPLFPGPPYPIQSGLFFPPLDHRF